MISNNIDIAILVILGIGVLVGWVRGFIKELIETVGFVFAAIVANYASPYTTEILGEWSATRTAAIIVWVIVFLLAMFIISKVGFLLGRLVRSIQLGGLNRLLGALFGFIKYTLMTCLVVTILEYICEQFESLPLGRLIEESSLVPYVHNVVSIVSPYIQQYIVEPASQML